MADVATAAGVGLKTVSRVVNGVKTVDPELAGRVHVAIEALGYRHNLLAATLKAGSRTGTIALVLRDTAEPLVPRLIAGVSRVAMAHGTHVIAVVDDGEPSVTTEVPVVTDLINRRVDGLILASSAPDHAWLGPELERGVKLVFLDRPPVGLVADTVVAADRDGARAAAAGLVAEGHHRVGLLLATPARASQAERWTGARAALSTAGLLLSQCPQLTGLGERTARDAVEHLLDGPFPPTALIAGDGAVAIGAAKALAGRRSTMPLVVLDAVPLIDLLPLDVRVVAVDAEEMGSQAARLLFARLDGLDSPPRTVRLPMVRQTSD